MALKFEEFSPTDICLYLRENIPSLSEDIFQAVLDHKIDGEVFLNLNDEYLREIAPLLGDRLKIKRILAASLSNVYTFTRFLVTIAITFLFYSSLPVTVLHRIRCLLRARNTISLHHQPLRYRSLVAH